MNLYPQTPGAYQCVRWRGLVLLLGVVLGAGVTAGSRAEAQPGPKPPARAGAESSRKAAIAELLATHADAERERQPPLSALLAVHSLRVRPSAHAVSTLSLVAPLLRREVATLESRNGTSAFSPDGKLLAVTGTQTRLYEAGSDEVRASLPASTNLVFSPDGGRIALGDGAGPARLYSTQGRLLFVLAPGEYVSRMAFSADGQRLVTLGGDHVWVFDTGTGKLRSTFQLAALPYDARLSPDGKYLACAARDGKVEWFETGRGKRIASLDAGVDMGFMAFSPDGRSLAVGGKRPRSYEASSGKPLVEFEPGGSHLLTYGPDGKLVAAEERVGGTSAVVVYDASSGKRRVTLGREQDPKAALSALAFSPDGGSLAAADDSGRVRLFQLDGGALLAYLPGPKAPGTLAFSPKGALLSASGEANTRVFDVKGGQFPLPLPRQGLASAVAFGPDDTVALADSEGAARLYEAGTGRLLATFPHPGLVHAVAFSADGKLLATGANDRTAKVFEVNGARLVATFQHEGPVNGVAFSPDGKWLATAAGGDMSANVFEVAGGKRLVSMRHQGDVMSVAFSPDGRVLASGSLDGTARLIDATSGALLASFPHGDSVRSVAFSPDGTRLATASSDRTANLFDIASGTRTASFSHDDVVYSVAFTPDGKQLATGSWDRSARLFELSSGTLLARIPHQSPVVSVAIGPGARRLGVVSGVQGWLWPALPEGWMTQTCSYLRHELTPEQWRGYVAGLEPYRLACPGLPND